MKYVMFCCISYASLNMFSRNGLRMPCFFLLPTIAPPIFENFLIGLPQLNLAYSFLIIPGVQKVRYYFKTLIT